MTEKEIKTQLALGTLNVRDLTETDLKNIKTLETWNQLEQLWQNLIISNEWSYNNIIAFFEKYVFDTVKEEFNKSYNSQ